MGLSSLYRNTRILIIFNDTINKIGDLHMKLSVNAVIQSLSLAAQGLNQISGFIPVKYQFWVMIALSAIQGVTGILAHFSNTDGTPSSVIQVVSPKV